MRKLIVILMLLLFLPLTASTPYLTLIKTETSGSLAATGKDTIVCSAVLMSGDSIGVMLDFNKDSVSGVIKYQYITPNSNSNKALADLDTLLVFDCNDGQQAVFTGSIDRVAGCYTALLYIILTNDDVSSSPRTITTNVYSIIWR